MARRRRRLGAVEWVRSQAKLFILISFAFIATLFLIPNFGAYQSLMNNRGAQQGQDIVVAEVGEHEVMYRDFDTKLRQLSESFSYSMRDNYGINVQLDPMEQLNRQWRAVNEILSQHALDDVARERKITVSQQEVNEFYEQQKRAANPELFDRPANLSLLQRAFFWKEDRRIRQDFETELQRRYGTTPNQFKEIIRENLIRQRIVEEYTSQSIDEVAAEARALMEEFKSSYAEPGENEAPSNLKQLVNEHNEANTEYSRQLADGEIEVDESRVVLSPTYQSKEMIKRGEVSFADKLAEDKAFELQPGELSDVLDKDGQALYLVHVTDKDEPTIDDENAETIRQELVDKKRAEAAAGEEEPAAEGEETADDAQETDGEAQTGMDEPAAELPDVDVTVSNDEVLEELKARYTKVSFEMVKLTVPDYSGRLTYLITKELDARTPTIHDKLVKAYDVYLDDQRDEALGLLDEYLTEYPRSTMARWFRGYLYQEMYDESIADELNLEDAAAAEEEIVEEPVEEPAAMEEPAEETQDTEAATDDQPAEMPAEEPQAAEGDAEAQMTAEEPAADDMAAEETPAETEPEPEPAVEEIPEDTATFESTGNTELDNDLLPFWENAWTKYQLEDSGEMPGNAEYYQKALADYKIVLTGINPELSEEDQEIALMQASTLDPYYNLYLGQLYESAGQQRKAYMHYRLAVVYQGDSFNLISDLRRGFNGIDATEDVEAQDAAFQELSRKITDFQSAQAAAQAGAMGNPTVNLGASGNQNVRQGVEVEHADEGGEAAAETGGDDAGGGE